MAIACYSGYNQEDSVILNQSGIDRGLFRSVHYRTFRELEQRKGNAVEWIEKPGPDTKGLRVGSAYSKIDDDGLVAPGTPVFGKDVIIGKTTDLAEDTSELNQSAQRYRRRDVSHALHGNEYGVVDRVMVSTKLPEAVKIVKVRVRSIRIPQIGGTRGREGPEGGGAGGGGGALTVDVAPSYRRRRRRGAGPLPQTSLRRATARRARAA